MLSSLLLWICSEQAFSGYDLMAVYKSLAAAAIFETELPYPIHSSAGGRLAGLQTSGEFLRCNSCAA